MLAEPDGAGLALKPGNACIRLQPSVAGRAIFTVEGLRGARDELHPAPQALGEAHASQCGFCTAGGVVSLFGLSESARDARAGSKVPRTWMRS